MKTSLFIEPSLPPSWSKGYGSAILTAIGKFSDVCCRMICNPHMPHNIAYPNYLHACQNRNEVSRSRLDEFAAKTFRIVGHVKLVSGDTVALEVAFYGKGKGAAVGGLTTFISRTGETGLTVLKSAHEVVELESIPN